MIGFALYEIINDIISCGLIYNSFQHIEINGWEYYMLSAWKHMKEKKSLIDGDIGDILNENGKF